MAVSYWCTQKPGMRSVADVVKAASEVAASWSFAEEEPNPETSKALNPKSLNPLNPLNPKPLSPAAFRASEFNGACESKGLKHPGPKPYKRLVYPRRCRNSPGICGQTERSSTTACSSQQGHCRGAKAHCTCSCRWHS